MRKPFEAEAFKGSMHQKRGIVLGATPDRADGPGDITLRRTSMKKLIIFLTTLVFFVSVSFVCARDASREANMTAAKEQASALKKADEKMDAISKPAAKPAGEKKATKKSR